MARNIEKTRSTSLLNKDFDSFKKDAIDLYPFLRNLYESRRNKRISE